MIGKKKKKEEEEKKPKDPLMEALSTSLYILAILILTIVVIKYIGQRTQIMGSSMEPTLSDGDNVYVDKFSYLNREPERFEIVVFPCEDQIGTYYIKRVIGLPGETIFIDKETGYVYINGEKLEEDYVVYKSKKDGIAGTPLTLGEDEYFVMGDNRDNSLDSRAAEFGPVKREEIVGRAIIRLLPIKDFEILIGK